MTRKSVSVKKNVVMNAIRTVTQMIFPIITFPYTSRVLGPDGVGKIQFATSFVAYFVFLAAFGVPLYGIRQIAKVRDDPQKMRETAQELLVLHLCMSTIAIAVYFCILPFHSKLSNERALFSIVSSSIVLGALAMEWLYQGLEEYSYITMRSVVVSTLSTIGIFVFVHQKSDYLIAASITVAGTLGSSVLNFWNARKIVFHKRTEPLVPFRHVKSLLMIYAYGFVVNVYVNLDTVMLGFLSSPRNVGYYATAMRVTKVILAVIISMGTVMVPRLSYYVERGLTDEFNAIVKKSFSLVMMLCLPCMAALMLLSKEILVVFAGGQFEESSLCMIVTAPSVIMIGLTQILGFQILYPLGKEKLVVLSSAGGAILSVVLNLLLIPHFAHVGAAFGALGSEAAVLAIQIVLIVKHRPVAFPWAATLRYAGAAAAMSVFLYVVRVEIPALPVRLALAVPGGALVYFGILWALGDSFLLDNSRTIKQKFFRHA